MVFFIFHGFYLIFLLNFYHEFFQVSLLPILIILLPFQLCAFSKFHILIDAQFVVFSYVAAAILHSSLLLATRSKPSIAATAPHDLSHPAWITSSPSSKALIETWHELNL